MDKITEFYQETCQIKLNCVDLNYGAYEFRSIYGLKKNISENPDISYLYISNNDIRETLFLYQNSFSNEMELDKINHDEFREVSLSLLVPFEYRKELIDFVNQNIWQISHNNFWSYAYGQGISKNQTIDGDYIKSNFISFYSVLSDFNKKWDYLIDENPRAIHTGYIKGIFSYNAINSSQANKIDISRLSEYKLGELSRIGGMIIWILDENDAKKIKSILKNNDYINYL